MMNAKAKVYALVLLAAAIGAGYYLFTNFTLDDWPSFIFWALMALLSETFMIRLPGGRAVSVGLAIGLAATVVGGPLMAALAMSFGVVFRMPAIDGKKRANIFTTHPIKTIFNFSQIFLTTAASGLIYNAAGGRTGSFSMIPALLLIFSYVLLNSLMFAFLFKLLSGGRFFGIWMANNRGFLVNTVAVGMLGIILALANISFSIWAVLLFLGPLFLARYSFKLYLDIKKTYFDTIASLNRTIEAKDPYTGGHAGRVGELSIGIATEMKLPPKVVERLKGASLLHDIGKIGIEDSILKKSELLDADEYEIIKRHPEIGSDIIGEVDFLKDISSIVRHHHERWDGTGYPDGISGEAIPVESRILAAADMYDAMTSDRPYRKALTEEAAMDELVKCRGTQLSPEVCDAFMTWLNMHRILGREDK